MVWIARIHERRDDGTRVRSQCRDAVKEYNATHDVEVTPQDWERRVGIWVD